MIERPLDRLNYYNGQRLEASDLKLEQDYHIRVRRWINKSLYKPGIASGLDIRAQEGTRFVIVSPGLGLDAEGREILLLDEETICVPGLPHPEGSDAEVQGPYLTIRYNEESIREERNGCSTRDKNGSRAAWGGPALVRAKPLFDWSDSLPYESSGEIVLAQVELEPDCSAVHQINTGVRRYVGPASEAKVRQYALDGEREVAYIPNLDQAGRPQGPATEVKARISFHVRGRQPEAVTLYLRAGVFSPLHYTELGNHNHSLDVEADVGTSGPIRQSDPEKYKHSHHVQGIRTAPGDGDHENHGLVVAFAGRHSNENGGSLRVETEGMMFPYGSSSLVPVTNAPTLPSAVVNLPLIRGGLVYNNILPVFDDPTRSAANGGPFTAKISGGSHDHGFGATAETEKVQPFDDHTHTVSPQVGLGSAGVTNLTARSGPALTYVDNLTLKIDGRDVTRAVVEQLKDADSNWAAHSKDKLGDGTSSHPLAHEDLDAVPIKLDFLPGVSFSEGEHTIELSAPEIKNANGVAQPNGGRILYNLYVE